MPTDALRSEAAILGDLQDLCAEPGFLHAYAWLCIRDNFAYFTEEYDAEVVKEFHARSQLVRSELNTLLGLTVKAGVDDSSVSMDTVTGYVSQADKLLGELHQTMNQPVVESLKAAIDAGSDDNPFASGSMMREPIFYAGDSAYVSQYLELFPEKYAMDDAWLLSNKGFTVQDATTVARTLIKLMDKGLPRCLQSLIGSSLDPSNVSRCFCFNTEEVAVHAGIENARVANVISALSVPAGEVNREFNSLHDFNIVNAFPLIPSGVGEFYFFNQFNLVEALYESPFFWMYSDSEYRHRAESHRGKFTENFAHRSLVRVFGNSCVYKNVDLYKGARNRVGEVDTLVLHGTRAIVLQAKSKRLTVEARKGADQAVRNDFQKAIQNSYDQGLNCAQFLVDPDIQADADGESLRLPSKFERIYLVCLVSDHYPALSIQAKNFLRNQTTERIGAPLVLDVFALDTITEVVDTPLQMLHYLEQRSSVFESHLSNHETAMLGFFLEEGRLKSDAYDRVVVTDDFAVEIDALMGVRRDDLPGSSELHGRQSRLSGSAVGMIIDSFSATTDPNLVGFGMALLSMSEHELSVVSEGIDKITSLVVRDGLSHDFSFAPSSREFGVTIHCNTIPLGLARDSLAVHCAKRKSMEDARSWYGLCIHPNLGVRFGLALQY